MLRKYVNNKKNIVTWGDCVCIDFYPTPHLSHRHAAGPQAWSTRPADWHTRLSTAGTRTWGRGEGRDRGGQ